MGGIACQHCSATSPAIMIGMRGKGCFDPFDIGMVAKLAKNVIAPKIALLPVITSLGRIQRQHHIHIFAAMQRVMHEMCALTKP